MSELRYDRLTGDWVVIAPERRKRGSDWTASSEQINPQKKCPFCVGNEAETPPEVLAIRPAGLVANGPGWQLRVVPNKFPALGKNTGGLKKNKSLFPVQPGIGAHEVVIESPEHDFSIETAEISHLETWLGIVGQRMREHKKQPEIVYTTLFKNSGRSAGASLVHSHSQLIGLPIIPNRIQREVINLEQYYHETRHCLVCDLIKEELAKNERIVYVSRNYVVLIPFASRYPYETWILPIAHAPFYEDQSAEKETELAHLIQRVRQAQLDVLHTPDYNLMVLTGPQKTDYHWRVMIIPKISNIAGLERGTDLFINVVPPEISAKKLSNSMHS